MVTPQRMVQVGQPYVATRASLQRWPSTARQGVLSLAEVADGETGHFVAEGRTPVVLWMDQPVCLSIWPTFFKSPVPGLHGRRIGLGMGLEPLTTMAFRSLDPMTAPMPERPPARPSRLRIDGVAGHVFAALADVEDADAFAVFP